MTDTVTVHAASDLEAQVSKLDTRDPVPAYPPPILADVRTDKPPAFTWDDVPAGYSLRTETKPENED